MATKDQVKTLELALAKAIYERDQALNNGGICQECAAKARTGKELEDRKAEESEAETRRLGEIATATTKRLELLDLREINRDGIDPHKLEGKAAVLEEEYNADIRRLNYIIYGGSC